MTEATYRIEILDEGRWIPAPGEATGWTLDEAQRAVASPMYGLDGSTIAPTSVRIVDETTGDIAKRRGPIQYRTAEPEATGDVVED